MGEMKRHLSFFLAKYYNIQTINNHFQYLFAQFSGYFSNFQQFFSNFFRLLWFFLDFRLF